MTIYFFGVAQVFLEEFYQVAVFNIIVILIFHKQHFDACEQQEGSKI